MKYLIAFLASLSLLAALPAYAKPKAAPAPQKQEQAIPKGCELAIEVLVRVDKELSITDGAVAKPEIAQQLIALAKLEAKNYDFVVVLAHEHDEFGVLFGFKLDGTNPVLCEGGLVPQKLLPAFGKIIGIEIEPKGGGSI